MDLFSVLTMLGGLALFLYGMNIMGDGLAKMAGGKLERILEKLTSSLPKAVLLGAAVTAVIQSSSATTVMVVGFVNSGIMKLSQAVGVIMGANIGTTATSWILSLASIEGSNFFLQLLKPSSFSPVLAVVGVAFIMFSKNTKKKDVGGIMIGFAILMFGMETMSGAVEPLKDVPEFTNILLMFSNPILGMIAGAVLTAVIQSSSASVGILQALCVTGAVPYATALPIIMGQNIGTCVTALISGIGASKNARRASLVHLYFNLIGTIVFMVVFYLLNTFVNFAFLDMAANAGGIALIHSVFNIAATVLLLPFSQVLVKLACLTIPDHEEEPVVVRQDTDIVKLDPRFLKTPAFAIEQCRNTTLRMAEISRQSLELAMGLVTGGYQEEVGSEVVRLENVVDQYEDHLGTYLVQLSKQKLSSRDSDTLSLLLHCIGDFERISDHAINIKEAVEKMGPGNVSFSKKSIEEMQVFTDALREIMDNAVEAFRNQDLALAQRIEPLEEVIDNLNSEIKERHIERLRRGKCTIEAGMVQSDITTSLERVADHCSNIACDMIEIGQDDYMRHNYKETIKSGDNLTFKEEYQLYKEKYVLPQSRLIEKREQREALRRQMLENGIFKEKKDKKSRKTKEADAAEQKTKEQDTQEQKAPEQETPERKTAE